MLSTHVQPFFEWLYSNTPPPRRHKTKDMQILCLGMSRSGTDSLAQALRILGYDKVYHGWDAMRNYEDHVLWRKAYKAQYKGGQLMEGKDWDHLLGDCEAVLDQYAAVNAVQLMTAYPNAKIMLNTRNEDDWYKSVCKTFFDPVIEERWTIIRWHFANALWQAEHCQNVRDLAKDQGRMGNFLEWQVTEGWEPLCTFLGRDVPQEDFPHGNGTDAFMQEMGRMFMDREARAKRNIAVTLGVFVAAVAVGVAGLMGGLR